MTDNFVADLLRHRPDGGWPTGAITLTAGDAAKLLGVSASTLRDWVARGHITRQRDNEYDMGEVMNYLARRASTGYRESS